MKRRIFALRCLAILFLSLASMKSEAATVGFWAADDAQNDTWGNNVSGGYGFGNWTTGSQNGGQFNFFSTNNNGAGASTQGDIDTGSTGATASWGMFSNGGLTDIFRSINSVNSQDTTTSAMVLGQTLRFDVDTGTVDAGKSTGYTLRNGATDIFEFRADGSSANYIIKVNGTDTATTVAKTTAGLRTEFTLVGGNDFVFKIYSTAATPVLLQTLTGTLSDASNINVARAFSTNNTGAAKNTYFNSLQVKTPTWTATSGNWSSGSNWSAGNVADGTPIDGNSIAFNGTGGTSTNDTRSSLYNISFNKSGTPVTNGPTIANAGAYTIAGDATHTNLTINGGIDNNSPNTQTFTTGLILGANQSFNNNSTGSLVFGSAVGAGNGAVDLKANTLTTKGTNTFNGVISNSTGSGSITVSSGTTILAATNSYGGGTNINAGTLQLGAGGTTGSAGSGTIAIAGAAILAFNRTDAPSFSNTISLGPSGTSFFSVAASTSATLTGSITSGGSEFWKDGAGTLVVNNSANSFTQSVVIKAGTLETDSLSNAGSNSSLGKGGIFIGQAGSGTLRYTGATATTDRIGGSALQGGTSNTIDVSSAATNLTIANGLGGFTNAPLTKAGAGILTLAAAGSYSGPTNVSAGTLLANGGTVGAGTSATGTGNVTVNNTGTLGGTGRISGTVGVDSGGTLNPGGSGAAGSAAAVGTLNTGALTLNPTSFSKFDVSGVSTYDQLVSSGLLTLGGSLSVTVASGLNFSSGTTLHLFGGTSETGTFTGVVDNQAVTYSGYNFTADYTTTGFDLIAVPEPSTWAAGILAVASLGYSQRRRVSRLLTFG
jgi:fibronectin-binding autotransporter adhesin